MRNKGCSNCGGVNARRPQRYCHECHASYMRRTRPRHAELPEDQRRRAVARAYANVYRKRGLLKPKPCERCGSKNVQMHHDDYSQPLQVRWLCLTCHHDLHRTSA
jgi:ribosomal protein S27AE